MPETEPSPTTPVADPAASPAGPFHDLAGYVALRRLTGLALSPDGSRLIASASELDTKKTAYVSALWQVDPTGAQPASRLTRSAPGESAPVVLPDNSVLFLSSRPDPGAEDDEKRSRVWQLPAAGGEARPVLARDGGITGVAAATAADTVVVTGPAFAGTDSEEQDAGKRKDRKDSKVAAILHDGYPVRFWDHDLGPEQPRYFAATLPGANAPAGTGADLRDLTADAGRAFFEGTPVVSRDGTFLVTNWLRTDGHVDLVSDLVRIDIATGARTVLAAAPRTMWGDAAISPDGATVLAVREESGTVDHPGMVTLWRLDGATGQDRREYPLPDQLRPGSLRFSPDGTTLYFTADQRGHCPLFALDLASGRVRRLTADGAYTYPCVHPDGRRVFALRTSYVDPGSVVALDVSADEQAGTVLPGPGSTPSLPGTLTEVSTTVADGTTVRGYLVLPEGASAERPAPLLLWVHGGPVSSWNAWSWRWCPWLMVAAGYAVLLPDPALSTGYGQHMIQRGWGDWGGVPFQDLMAITDEVLRRPDLDAGRTAMMGGSFGGYMANWIAGHTDRFKAIVTHASLWSLTTFGPTTDTPNFWRDEMSPERAAANSPSAAIDAIRTPMLVVHGDKDYRVPLAEGLALWWELLSHADPKAELPHRFLYFPDENHWVLSPQHAKIWYGVVLAFLAWHVLGEPFTPPELL